MNKNIEKELKVLLTEKQFTALCNVYENLEFKKQVNTYYDTADQAIRNMHGAMRIREKNGKFIFTLKKHSTEGLLEFECEVPENTIKVFDSNDIQKLLLSYDIQGPFHELTSLTTYRAVYDNGYAEICFDKNQYNGITDYEIEYEYKKDHDGICMFQEILDIVNIKYESNCISKIQRALNSINNDF